MSKKAKVKKNKDFESDLEDDAQSIENKGKEKKGKLEEKLSKKKKGGKKAADVRQVN
jgi:hypothetical protein